ncbi:MULTISPECIES: DUF2147 domain-containing protein [unclassified Tenacibaculum]|uniref:DUF2147 domain-containing protein n=1 Tax=unclassified Tenacibaculum TaxID=2635139 RepID=UPI001F3E78AC|nr:MULTISPECIES: DUF2147 domain-containing protein [unclassified Tenacibaculum]MCF2873371.1 DUF2147 domain-containing protein [Tenacibaculum sp. Cn5-1]MCF2933527.1 DUF2147 domain-containing protein [Tenacibaculum sp. Cn5-34]MCG7509891.1 DUF2147 domain-containing protein [Tenacibaculum sp. Cn5-46]
MKQLLLTFLCLVTLISCAQNNDEIVGVWTVKNQYYEAEYEVVEYKGKFFGKIHYYNDGKNEYKGNNEKKDYFLTDVEKKGEKYVNGKMYLPGGAYYEVIFTLNNKDKLEALMTVEGQPYKETWKRKKKK